MATNKWEPVDPKTVEDAIERMEYGYLPKHYEHGGGGARPEPIKHPHHKIQNWLLLRIARALESIASKRNYTGPVFDNEVTDGQ